MVQPNNYLVLLLMCIRQMIFVQGGAAGQGRNIPPPILVFPITAPTRQQLIFGIGIPEGDLDFESLTNGWVLKYEYFLPSNVTQLYIPAQLNIAGRSIPDENKQNEVYDAEAVQIDMGFDSEEPSADVKGEDEFDTEFKSSWELTKNEQKTLSKYRWAFYKALEAAGDRKGFVGRACVLKSICETSVIPFHYQNGLMAELIHIMLTPSTSVDEISTHSDNEYFQAEVLGKSGARCETVFRECESSLLEIFTHVLDVSDDLRKIFV